MTGELKKLGDRLDNKGLTASSTFWQVCEKIESGEHPNTERRILTGLIGRRAVMLLFGVLLRDLTRRPGEFTPQVAALANGMVREVGESLQVFPFEERVRAFEGLTRQLAAGLQIGLAFPGDAEQDAGDDADEVAS